MAGLAVTAEDRRDTREKLLEFLARETDSWEAGKFADVVTILDPTAEDRHDAHERLLRLLTRETDSGAAEGWSTQWPNSTPPSTSCRLGTHGLCRRQRRLKALRQFLSSGRSEFYL